MTFKLTFRELFEKLERIPDLQRKEWELNQSGIDRGLEAILIQRTTREAATYALVQLRFLAIPDIAATTPKVADNNAVGELLTWAKAQGPGASMMIRVINANPDDTDTRRIGALSVLRYYQNRDADNPIVKSPWTDEGLRRVPTLDINRLLEYPTPGDFWRKKHETIQQLVAEILKMDLGNMTDSDVLSRLRNIKGIGPQSASMIALFWLNRSTPVIDGYLTSLLANHNLVSESLSSSYAQDELRRFLSSGARDLTIQRSEWPANRSLASLYLWACEVGRFHCKCGKVPSQDCPLQRT